MDEDFDLASGSEQTLESGMIIAIEPTHIEPGLGRFRVEDAVLVTDDGVDVLSNFSSTESTFVIR